MEQFIKRFTESNTASKEVTHLNPHKTIPRLDDGGENAQIRTEQQTSLIFQLSTVFLQIHQLIGSQITRSKNSNTPLFFFT